MKEELKVVLIGAASPQWGHKLSRDLIVSLSQEKIRDRFDPVLVLEDIDPASLADVEQLSRTMAAAQGGHVRIDATTDQKKAIAGARFVGVTFAVGSLEMMQHEVDIPKEYGIFQPVGDTISIGGAIRACRNIPAYLTIARDIEQLARPDCWLFNMANPMSTLCRAVTRETKVKTIGCCHEFYGGMWFVTHLLGLGDDWWNVWRQRFKIAVNGINHCAWLYRCELDGQDALALLRHTLAERGITGEVRRLYDSSTPDLCSVSVKINLLLRHGVLPYSGDRHNVEFFTEFCNASTNRGADFGVLLTTPQERLVNWRGGARVEVRDLLAGKKEIDYRMSGEVIGRIIPAMVLDESFYDVGNLPYHGRELPGIPQGTVIERMVTYDARGAHPDKVEPLPPAVQEHFQLTARNIEDVVESAVTGNRKLLIRTLRRDPLMKNMASRKIPELVGRLLELNRQYVHPAFFDAGDHKPGQCAK